MSEIAGPVLTPGLQTYRAKPPFLADIEVNWLTLISPSLEKKLHILSQPAESDGPRRPVNGEDRGGDEASPAPGAPRFTPQEEGGKNIIPVYVSVLAAVVLGLLLYVAYKCCVPRVPKVEGSFSAVLSMGFDPILPSWTSCKQKQALGKARSGDAGVAPEGEKLHSDSGVFLDSHSLQDSQLSKGNHPRDHTGVFLASWTRKGGWCWRVTAGSKRDSKPDSRLYLNLPPHRQEEVEQLLQEGGDWSWRQLATQLGYEQERLDVFGRGEDPVHTLLSDWATQEGSTLGVLCSALTRIDRPDVASALCCPTQGSSVV
ncbi:hypothetical protein Z043_104378 [Scleropages formosus]|uniref:Death domain-containing protein n=1 Tax=Scleropages formosus TaxID=113540 RepID=A0A0P7VKD5_SCLFO|nr:hypothetical protein Z043_104378 [Scleropages formosus]